MLIGEKGLKVKAILVASDLLHFLISRLTDGGEVVGFTFHPAALYRQEDSWYSFLLEAESTLQP
jgi:hypothetical protein